VFYAARKEIRVGTEPIERRGGRVARGTAISGQLRHLRTAYEPKKNIKKEGGLITRIEDKSLPEEWGRRQRKNWWGKKKTRRVK